MCCVQLLLRLTNWHVVMNRIVGSLKRPIPRTKWMEGEDGSVEKSGQMIKMEGGKRVLEGIARPKYVLNNRIAVVVKALGRVWARMNESEHY